MIPPSRAIVALIVVQSAFHALFGMPYVMADALCPGSPTRENHIQVEELPCLPVPVVDEKAQPGHSKSLSQSYKALSPTVELAPWQVARWAFLKWPFAFGSDGRSWQPEITLSATPDGAIRLPPMQRGLAASFDDEIMK